jgi:hypothetical protein
MTEAEHVELFAKLRRMLTPPQLHDAARCVAMTTSKATPTRCNRHKMTGTTYCSTHCRMYDAAAAEAATRVATEQKAKKLVDAETRKAGRATTLARQQELLQEAVASERLARGLPVPVPVPVLVPVPAVPEPSLAASATFGFE